MAERNAAVDTETFDTKIYRRVTFAPCTVRLIVDVVDASLLARFRDNAKVIISSILFELNSCWMTLLKGALCRVKSFSMIQQISVIFFSFFFFFCNLFSLFLART